MRRLWVVALLGVGCLDLDFTSTGTNILVETQGKGSTSVTVCAGPSGLFSCNDDERFRAVVGGLEGGEPTPLFFGGQRFHVPLDTPGAEVLILRVRDGASARATLPEGFVLWSPAGGDPRRHGVTLRWSPSGSRDQMSWGAEINCAEGGARFTGDTFADDDGELTIDADDLPESAGDNCGLNVFIKRTRPGTMSAGFPAEKLDPRGPITLSPLRAAVISFRA